MKNIIFICHGNICRSPAAEFIAKNYLLSIGRNDEFNIISLAVSSEEIGNDVYPPMKKELMKEGIPFAYHQARKITQNDYDKADYIFYMDNSNLKIINYFIEDDRHIIYPINKWTPTIEYIEDPWYTGNYQKVCFEIKQCVKDIFNNI